MKEPVNHHFVPQGYLRGFADGTGSKARVWVADRTKADPFPTNIRNVAAQRDFNRINPIPGGDPYALEKAMGQLEGQVAPALRRSDEAAAFASDEDRQLILTLIGHLAIRNPRFRKNVGDALVQSARIINDITLSSKERYESAMRGAMADGAFGPDHSIIPYEEMKDFIDRGEYEIVPDQTFQIEMELKNLDHVVELLFHRKWSWYRAADAAGDFITSDHPMCLFDVSGRKPHPLYGVGLGMTQTAVLFPIGRKTALIGRFEGEEGIHEIGSREVAAMNSEVILRAQRQVYAYDDRFNYIGNGGWMPGHMLPLDPIFRRD
ncbi:MAG: DUF4238 domain-containing protein [Exiguobacterium profundum]|nr:MAG: DUF4238 domain-containing protein [Exiguobacterium profundum]